MRLLTAPLHVLWEIGYGILALAGIILIGYLLLFALPAFMAIMVAMLIVLVAIFVRLGRRAS